MLNVLIRGPAKNIKERCEPRGTAWYLRSYNCVKDSRPDIDQCMDTLKSEFHSINRSPHLDDWLPTGCLIESAFDCDADLVVIVVMFAGCCFFSKFMACFDRNINTYCNEDGVKYLHWCRDSYLGDTVDLICSREYAFGSDKCAALIAKIPASNGTEPLPRSVLLPVYQMFQAYERAGRKDGPRPF